MSGKPKPKHQVCVYGGASDRAPEAHKQAAMALGVGLARAGYGLVFGGGSAGIMGATCEGAMAENGYIIGVITEFLKVEERLRAGLDELHVVETMRKRKMGLFERADLIVIAPGGLGTLDEFFEVLTLRQLGRHDKPLLLANFAGFWDPLIAMLQHLDAQGYLHHRHEDIYEVHDTSEALLKRMTDLL